MKKAAPQPFIFALGEEVMIKALEMKAMITGMATCMEGQQYRISYWYNGLRVEVWVCPHEVQAIL